MHSLFHNSTNVPAFLVKLWKLVEDTSTNGLITWNHTGASFIITDADRFARELLPLYFKHNNLASFIRQLNIYGFKKVINYGKANDSQELEFQNAFFSKDRVELLANIKRKIGASKIITSESETTLNPKDIMVNLSTLREKQRAMDTTLNQMKKENEILWRELSTVRQRHKAQEQVLHKVIQFLVQIIQRSNQNIHVPRKLARMLQDSSVSQENSSQIARIVDVLRSKDSDFVKGQDEVSQSSLGAVIHEVTDVEPETNNFINTQHNKTFGSTILKTNNNKKSAVNLKQSNTIFSPKSVNFTAELSNSGIVESETSAKISQNFPSKFVAVPIEKDQGKFYLVPLENFTDEEISSLSKDSLCNVIALPQDESSNSNKGEQMDCVRENYSKSDLSNNSKIEENCYSTNNVSDSISTASNSNVISCDLVSKQNSDDSLLADLLKASKISNSSSDQEKESNSNIITDTLLSSTENDALTSQSHENCNNQVAIPGPSSLVKSTKNFFPDFSILQDPINPSTVDMKLFEQLLSGDESMNIDSLTNISFGDSDINLASEDIIGNELVQFTPLVSEDNTDQDQFQWLDIFSNETSITETDAIDDLICGPKDLDVLLQSDDSIFPYNLELVKKETLLTGPTNHPRKIQQKNKRRKCT